jgi:hypothetical protein
MLGNVFLLNATSRYLAINPIERSTQSPEPPRHGSHLLLTGSFRFLGPWEEFRAAAHEATHEVYVKTHEPADDDSRTIYVVRDPCSAFVSYFHFLRARHPDLSVTQEDVIRGLVGYGS